jgi:CheY-like chemotaxis protein
MLNILVIDDEEDVRDAMRLTLERAGHSVAVAPRGSEGIEMLHTQHMDVIITDIVMPGQNGVDTIKALRSAFPHSKIIAISGGGNLGPGGYQPHAVKTAAYLAAAEAAGADLSLTKPFDRRELLSAVDRVAHSTRH